MNKPVNYYTCKGMETVLHNSDFNSLLLEITGFSLKCFSQKWEFRRQGYYIQPNQEDE